LALAGWVGIPSGHLHLSRKPGLDPLAGLLHGVRNRVSIRTMPRLWRSPMGWIRKEIPMKSLVSTIAFTLAVAFAAPAFAGPETAPANQADCEKAGMKWDSATSTCQEGKM
jgi:hypothetical protein